MMEFLSDSDVPPPPEEIAQLEVDPVLLRAIMQGVRTGVKMTHRRAVPVGASRLTTARHGITVMVGLVGELSGNLALNFSEESSFYIASGLLGEPLTGLTEDCVDAIMEIGNMTGGGIKAALSSTEYAISNISLPSLILGQSYSMVAARGIRCVSVEFELADMPFTPMNARYFSATVSLLGGAGRPRL